MIHVGIIGCGYWGPNLIRNFHTSKNSKVVVICDMDEHRLHTIGSLYPSAKQVKDANVLFDDPDVDAVVIATPVHTHYKLALRALSKGKHVLVEKPIAASSNEARSLIRAASRYKRILMVDHTFIYSPSIKKIKQLIDANELGKLCYIDSVRINLGLFESSTNVLWDLATHDISIIDHLIGKNPLSVSSVGASHIKKGLVNTAYLTIHYPTNIIAHIHVNWLAPVKMRTTLISGLKKMIVYNDMEPIEKVKVYDRGITYYPQESNSNLAKFQYRVGDMYSPRIDDIEALSQVTKHFLDCIDKKSNPLTDGKAGLRIVNILEAAEHSINHNGKHMSLSL